MPAKYPFNDWSTPTDTEKLNDFAERVTELANKTFGVDQDGDPAVQVKVIDRTRYEKARLWPVPYEQNAHTEEELAQVEKAVVINLQLAMSAFEQFMKVKPYRMAAFAKKRDRKIQALEAQIAALKAPSTEPNGPGF